MFKNVLLEPEQKELLSKLVEATRNVPRDQRRKFMVVRVHSGDYLMHPGLPDGRLDVYFGDIDILAAKGLILLSYESSGTPLFDVMPEGFAYYTQMRQASGQPVQQVEIEIRNYLDAEPFQDKYSVAYQKWADAQEKLWASDSERQFTTIGHLCREAIQEFATALVDRFQPPAVNEDKARVLNRVRAVLDCQRDKLGSTEKDCLEALFKYWSTLNDLAQRQEHGGQREGKPLIWEDARRLVFQTAVLMFEIDRSLAH